MSVTKAEKPIEVLTDLERQELTERVTRITTTEFNSLTTIGEELFEIQQKKLYREHGRFEDFVAAHFDFKWQRAYQYIDAFKVVRVLREHGVGNLPRREAHCRPLVKLLDNPEKLVEVWRQATADGEPKAEVIQRLAETSTNVETEPQRLPQAGHAETPALERMADCVAVLKGLVEEVTDNKEWRKQVREAKRCIRAMSKKLPRRMLQKAAA